MQLEVGNCGDQVSDKRIVAAFWRDVLFWLAFAAGPIVCFVAAWIYVPDLDIALPAGEFGRLLILVVAYPVVEEIVFRGALQGWVLGLSWGRHRFACFSVANIITSFVFAGLHGFYHPALMAALVFFPSLVFGFFRERTGVLPASMMLHCSYNLFYFLVFGLPLVNS